jgi:hypothetical protein
MRFNLVAVQFEIWAVAATPPEVAVLIVAPPTHGELALQERIQKLDYGSPVGEEENEVILPLNRTVRTEDSLDHSKHRDASLT